MEAIMKLRDLKVHRLLIPLAGLVMWACAEPSTAPDGVKRDVLIKPQFSVVQVSGQRALLEGRIELCKATESIGAPATTFTFDVAIDGGGAADQDVAVGACVDIVNDQSIGNSHTATVSEQAETDWALDSIRVEFPTECVNFPSSEDGTTASLQSNDDCGARVIFWNTWTEPDVPEGCTLTQGYWKTHSDLGPAPFDDTWDLLPSGSSTIFYLSGQTWYQAFHTAPAGNAYYNLAHHYMAAVLNGLAGADLSAVSSEIITADGLFSTWTPAQIGALKGNDALRQQFISLAGVLGAYNEGITGPGHCED
jgi:hypothetical protein